MLILHSYSGWPGCTHDARVLRNSSLLARAGRLFTPGTFLLRDTAYPVKNWLITPYKDNGHLTVERRRFNRKVSSVRQVVERAIGHLKGRFRRLRSIHVYDVESLIKITQCGCILHNICVLSGDELHDFIEADPDLNPNNYQHIHGNADVGLEFRNQLVTQLH